MANWKADSERLTTGNFIEEKNKTFSATLKVKRAYAKITSPRRAADKELSGINQFIGAAVTTDEPPQLNDLKYAGFSTQKISGSV